MPPISAAEWEFHHATIQRLYIAEDQKLPQVIKHMSILGFKATRGQYVRQFDKWGLFKNLSAKDWRGISREIKIRTRKGKQSQVILNGALLPPEKVLRQTYTHDPPTMFARSPSPGLMKGILVCTPPPSTQISEEVLEKAELESSFEVMDDVVACTTQGSPPLAQGLSPTQLFRTRSSSMVTMVTPAQTVEIIVPEDLLYYVFEKRLKSGGELFACLRESHTDGYLALDVLNAVRIASGGCEFIIDSILSDAQIALQSFSNSLIGRQTTGADPMRTTGPVEKLLHAFLPPACGETPWQILNMSNDSELSLALRLIQYIVFVSANNLDAVKEDTTMKYVQEALTEWDDLGTFLQWVINNNLYVVIERIVDPKTQATEIFASQALICAVDMEDFKLVQSLFKGKPRLDARRQISPVSSNKDWTALELAVHLRNLKIIRLLLAAATDPRSARQIFCSLETIMNGPLQIIVATFRSSSDVDLEILKALLHTQESLGRADYLRKCWIKAARIAIFQDVVEALEVILNNLGRLEQSFFLSSDLLLQLELAFWQSDLGSAQELLNQGLEIQPQFDVRKLHAQLLFVPSLSKITWCNTLRSPTELKFVLLRLAVGSGDIQLVKLALEIGGEVLQIGVYAADIFHFVIENGDKKVLDILLDTGVDINGHGLNLLSGAVYAGDCGLATLLLVRGANPHLPPKLCHPTMRRLCCWPIVQAIKRGKEDMEALLFSTDQRMPLEEMQRLLLVSITHGGFTKVKQVVENCVRINSIGPFAVLQTLGPSLCTGLVLLLNRAGLECLKWLVDNEVDLSLMSSYFEGNHRILSKAFWLACDPTLYSTTRVTFEASPDVLSYLFDLGVAPGDGLLKLCARSCTRFNTANMRLLLDRRKALCMPCPQSTMTEIFEEIAEHCHDRQPGKITACLKYHFAMIRWLVDQGALVNDPWLDYTLRSKTPGARQLAWDTFKANSKWTAAIRAGQTALKKLLNFGANVNEVWNSYPYPKTPLIAAVGMRNHVMISYLLQNGADVNQRPSRWCGDSLELAVQGGDLQAVLELLRAGANVNAKGGNHSSALQDSAARGYFQIMLELLRAGADVNASWNSRTALQSAAENGRLDIVRLLINNNPDSKKLHVDCLQGRKKSILQRPQCDRRTADKACQSPGREV